MTTELSSTGEKLAHFCDSTCPICTRARKKQSGANHWFVKNIDRKVCPMCKSYEKKFRIPAYEQHQ